MKNLITQKQKDQVDSICKQYGIKNYSINSDGSVDVDGGVYISGRGLTSLPLRFGRVRKNFECHRNRLTSLEGSPTYVGRNFTCSHNNLTNLVGSPAEVVGEFFCANNQLTSLEGSPIMLGGAFYCQSNKLTSLEGGPVEVGGDFTCNINNLLSLVGSPVTVGGKFRCGYNQLTSLDGIPTTVGGDFLCMHNNLVSTYSGNIDLEVVDGLDFGDNSLPQLLKDNIEHIKLILKYQRHFFIWNDDLTFNEDNFLILLDEIKDGLL